MWGEEKCENIPALKKAQYILRGGLMYVSLARLLSRTSPPVAGGPLFGFPSAWLQSAVCHLFAAQAGRPPVLVSG